MNTEDIDRCVSKIVLGTVDEDFHPSSNESDAWRVVDWMYQNRMRVNFKDISPARVCYEVLKVAS